MSQRLREILTMVLIGLLPFHAFVVTFLTKLILGPGHAPLPLLALWKEALLAAILLVTLVELLLKRQWSAFRVDRIDALILGLIVLSVILLALSRPPSFGSFALGVKYDFVPLIAFMMLRRVSWSDAFTKRLVTVILWTGGIVAAYGIFTMFLPLRFFTALGYSDLHSLYIPGGPLAAFQQLGGSGLRRIQSVMSGPNQLGLWLLLPYSLMLPRFLTTYPQTALRTRGYLALIGAALILTYSRSAWLGALAIFVAAVILSMPRQRVKHVLGQLGLLCMVGALFLVATTDILTRIASSRDHVRRPLAAIQTMIQHPFGLGLGTAGPASNRTSDACVLLEPGADASWAADRPDLCVFVGDQQVQPAPTDRACSCPFLTENWYLQLGVELGVFGFVLFLTLTILMLNRLRGGGAASRPVFLMFFGLSVASLFLHAWEDGALSWTAWMVGALLIAQKRFVHGFVEPNANR